MWIQFANFLDILRVYRHAWTFGRHEEYTGSAQKEPVDYRGWAPERIHK
jgi:hypothetical protein